MTVSAEGRWRLSPLSAGLATVCGMKTTRLCAAIVSACFVLSACAPAPQTSAGDDDGNSTVAADSAAVVVVQEADDSSEQSPADAFMAALASHCWRSYAGEIETNEPAQADDPFVGKPLIMHVRECTETQIRVPFHVGDDHSRTWVFTRTADGVRLKHDHRHPDGSEDALTQYGGDSTAASSATRQDFPADSETRALFEREGIPVSMDNIWSVTIDPQQRMVYELNRPSRVFRVVFDLTQAVPTPPEPWGAEPPPL